MPCHHESDRNRQIHVFVDLKSPSDLLLQLAGERVTTHWHADVIHSVVAPKDVAVRAGHRTALRIPSGGCDTDCRLLRYAQFDEGQVWRLQ